MNPHGRIRDSKNNDAFNPREKQIEQEGEAYWENRKKEFPERDGTATIAEPAIFHRQRMVLDEIMEVLRRHTEDYHNYYEAGHYRPLLGNKLLERIYKRQ